MTTVKLGDVVQITSGFAFPSSGFSTEEGIPLVRIRDVTRGVSETRYAGPFDEDYVVNDGDLLVGMDGEFNAALWRGGRALLNQRVCRLVPDPSRLDFGFLRHVLPRELKAIEDRTPFVTVKHLSVKDIRAIVLALPPLAEQRRIATILDKADSLRSKRQEAIRLAEEFLRVVFIDMFGGLDNATYPQVVLADVVTLDAPMVEPTSDDFADMLHVGPDRIEKGNGQLLACETARAEGLTSKKFLFDERYVLYSKIRPALKKCALAEFRGLCSADMYPVRPSGSEVTREFIWGLLLSGAFDRYVSTLPDRANIPKLNRVELNAFQFRLPPIESQRKYSSIVQRTMALKRQHYAFLKQAAALPASLGFFN